MRRICIVLALALAAAAPAAAKETAKASGKKAEWHMNATIIEACSCPMFCQCYFSTRPAAHAAGGGHDHGHGEEHFCRFNNAFKVNKGHHRGVKLDGAQFWVYGDLGAEFDDGEMDWAVATFDKSTTPEQREAIGAILAHLYPVKWKSFSTAEGVMEWKADAKTAHATLDGGRTAEVALGTSTLTRNRASEPMVIQNLKYWGAPRNDGFVLMPNTVEAVRVGDRAFEYRGTNGFMITVDIDANDVAGAGGH